MDRRNSPQAGAVLLVLGGIVSVQVGASVAKNLFDDVGPAGAVFLRVGFAALLLVAIWRPSLRGLPREHMRDIALFGFVLAAMNFSFYEALDRIPLGIAVTLEFVGPLAVAIWASRRRADLVWVALAAAGILLLSPSPAARYRPRVPPWRCSPASSGPSTSCSRRGSGAPPRGRAAGAGDGVRRRAAVAGGRGARRRARQPRRPRRGLAVAVLSSAIPYSLELEALRRLARGTFGVLMSLEPAVAAAVGFVALGQDLAARELVAIALVVAASAGALRTSPPVAEA